MNHYTILSIPLYTVVTHPFVAGGLATPILES